MGATASRVTGIAADERSTVVSTGNTFTLINKDPNGITTAISARGDSIVKTTSDNWTLDTSAAHNE